MNLKELQVHLMFILEININNIMDPIYDNGKFKIENIHFDKELIDKNIHYIMWNHQEQFLLKRDYEHDYNVTYIVANNKDRKYLENKSLKCEKLTHNLLGSYNKLKILNIKKKYNFIFNGGGSDVSHKNQFLCERMEKLAIIDRRTEKNKNLTPCISYDFFNKGRLLSKEEVNILNNQSKIGLMLSWAEGGCYALFEYLLCGLPVISLEDNVCPKNVFLNEKNSMLLNIDDIVDLSDYRGITIKNRTNEKQQKQIKERLLDISSAMLKKDYDPEWIRENALIQLKEERTKYLTLIKNIVENNGYEFSETFLNKMGQKWIK